MDAHKYIGIRNRSEHLVNDYGWALQGFPGDFFFVASFARDKARDKSSPDQVRSSIENPPCTLIAIPLDNPVLFNKYEAEDTGTITILLTSNGLSAKRMSVEIQNTGDGT